MPGSLKSLAETMCPELGGKGSIPYDELNEFNISELKFELIKYMEQDILILAGVLRKAQEKYWDRYMVDITNNLTVSSMAMKIYRTHYYPSTYPIYRPQHNKAAFILEDITVVILTCTYPTGKVYSTTMSTRYIPTFDKANARRKTSMEW